MSVLSASLFQTFLAWIETTAPARAIAESLQLTAWLSASHLIGFTLVMGGALVANLRSLGLVLAHRAAIEISGAATRAIALGLAISIATGLLMFSGRATAVAASGTFQLKMLLLVAATVFHFASLRFTTRAQEGSTPALRTAGMLGLALWLGLAVTACAFILFE